MRESSSFDVLTRNSDLVAILDQRSKGESLSSSPINISSFLDALQPDIKDFPDLPVEVVIFRKSRDGSTNFSNLLNWDTRYDLRLHIDVHDFGPLRRHPVLRLVLKSSALLVAVLEDVVDLGLHALDFVSRQHSFIK